MAIKMRRSEFIPNHLEMKFKPRPHYGDFEDTRRKRLAAERRQQRERDRLPLFAEQIAAEQPSIDEVMQQRAEAWARSEQTSRDRLAAIWRSVRADIAALLPEQKEQIRARAESYGGPLNPLAYAYFYREITGCHRPGIKQLYG